MARNNIRASILSLGAPATSIGKSEAEVVAFCRAMNEYAASLRDQSPAQFGFLATLPSLENTEACIAEIQYSLRTLNADGINLLTSYDGRYLGHPSFQPVWSELNRHAATVFVHPGLENAAGSIKEPQSLPAPLFDWTHETTRTAAHLITTNTLQSNGQCKIILSHGGGTLPYVANRIAHLGAQFHLSNKSAEEFLAEARSFYFDTAFVGYEEPLQLLLQFARPGHVLYGSDYPFGSEKIIDAQVENIDRVLRNRGDAMSIAQGAALELFPRLRGVLVGGLSED